MGGVACPRNTAPYILANILKLLLSSPLNATITGTIFIYFVSIADGNSFLFMRSSSNANSKSGLVDAILDQN